ncbi:MAG TPA: MFS transporter [Gammaproteobacteria bacterium]|nr:MFS transporter [Gammaproteobacteria bacterium]
MTKQSAHFFAKASPLFLAIFIDGMGLGLLFPILNSLFIGTHNHFLPGDVSSHTRNLLFGITVSIFMLAWFFGAAYLGDLSDAIGRKKSLVICLFGAFLGYLISAVAVGMHSITFLIIGRVIAGFTAGSQAIAQAAIIDISEPDMKARNIGLILMFASLGFLFGPMCGGFFSSPQIYSGFTYSTPLYFAAFISLVNAFLLIWLFKETFKKRTKIHLKFHRAIEIFISAFQNHKVRYLSFVLFLMLLGWACVYSFISLFLTKVLGYHSTGVNLYMASMAIGFGTGFAFIVNWVTHHFTTKKVIVASLFLCGLISLIISLTTTAWVVWLLVIPIGMSVAVPYSTLLAVFSNQVDENSQGWVMGITNAIGSAAFAIMGFGGALLANWGAFVPILTGSLFFLASSVAMGYSKIKK